jgi:hypothetical protein
VESISGPTPYAIFSVLLRLNSKSGLDAESSWRRLAS